MGTLMHSNSSRAPLAAPAANGCRAAPCCCPPALPPARPLRYYAEPMKAAHTVYVTTRHMTQRLSWTGGSVHVPVLTAASVATAADLLVNVSHGRYYYDGTATPNGWQVMIMGDVGLGWWVGWGRAVGLGGRCGSAGEARVQGPARQPAATAACSCTAP